MFLPTTGLPISASSFESALAISAVIQNSPRVQMNHGRQLAWLRNEQNISFYSMKGAAGFQAKLFSVSLHWPHFKVVRIDVQRAGSHHLRLLQPRHNVFGGHRRFDLLHYDEVG